MGDLLALWEFHHSPDDSARLCLRDESYTPDYSANSSRHLLRVLFDAGFMCMAYSLVFFCIRFLLFPVIRDFIWVACLPIPVFFEVFTGSSIQNYSPLCFCRLSIRLFRLFGLN